MGARTGQVAALLFGSGFCALVYQVAWLREFRLIFGASTAASAAVLAIFIGGLGAGGLLLGTRIDRHPRPLLLYSTLEAIVGVFAAISPWLLMLARAVYLASGGSERLGAAAATIERLALSTLVLAVPTVAMGGTLPAAARAVTRSGDRRRQNLATLYGINTLGAVAGCLVATFFMLETFGTRATLWLAAAVNILVAVSARAVDRRLAARAADTAPPDQALALPAQALVLPADDTRATPESDAAAPRLFLLLASGTVGFAFFLMELVWYRLLGPLLGGSVFTFGLVLAVALAGIGLGGLLYALVSDDRPASLAGFATCCLVEAVLVAATFALGDRTALLALALLPLGGTAFTAAIAGWTLVAALVILAPAIVAGYQFPMLMALFGRGRAHLGRDVGHAYAANTAGSILGSLAGGFGALPWLSAPGVWRLVAALLVGLGVAAVILDRARTPRDRPAASPPARRWRPMWPLAITALAILLLFAEGPTAVWRHAGIGAGRAPRDVMSSANQLRAWQQVHRAAIVWDRDGVESSIALAAETGGYSFIVNGKTDGSARLDAGTQVMLGLLGGLRHPRPQRALVVGLGTGSTAGWLGAIPSMERVDAIELEPLVIEVARASQPVNHDVLNNPKVRVIVGDAREWLLTSRDRYDVIASEPSNPFRAGIASLFTVEYYRAAAARLTADGVFAQWVQGYEIDARTLRTIYATMAAAFPQVETWQTNHGDLVLLATVRPRGYSTADLRARIAEPPFASALAHTWRAVDINGVLAHYLAGDAMARALASTRGAEINTDDRNVVEFGLARSVGRAGSVLVAEIRALAQAMGASRPALDSEQGVSWAAMDTAWANAVDWDAQTAAVRGQSPEEQRRQDAMRRYWQTNDVAGARDLWRGLTEPPRDPAELAIAADLEAQAGSDTALPLVEQLRAFEPSEADILLATLRWHQSRTEEAAAALESAFVRLRADPWPQPRYTQQALVIAEALAARDPSVARRLFEALRQPFSLRAVNPARLLAAVEIAKRFDFRGSCQAPIGALEPHVPWTAAFLLTRRDCYQANGDSRLADAERDLGAFFAHEPLRLSAR